MRSIAHDCEVQGTATSVTEEQLQKSEREKPNSGETNQHAPTKNPMQPASHCSSHTHADSTQTYHTTSIATYSAHTYVSSRHQRWHCTARMVTEECINTPIPSPPLVVVSLTLVPSSLATQRQMRRTDTTSLPVTASTPGSKATSTQCVAACCFLAGDSSLSSCFGCLQTEDTFLSTQPLQN